MNRNPRVSNFITNKKGDLSITLLVLLVVVLAGFTLFTFYTNSGKIEARVIDSRFIEGSYSAENAIEFDMESAGENALAKSYEEFVSRDFFARIQNKEIDFGGANLALNGEFLANMNKEFLVKKYESEKNLKLISSSVGKYFAETNLSGFYSVRSVSTEKGGNKLDWGFSQTPASAAGIAGSIIVVYNKNIQNKVYFERIGLYGLEKIYSLAKSCVVESDSTIAMQCLNEKMPNFNFNVFARDGGGFIIKAETKRTFSISGVQRKLNFALSTDTIGNFAR